MLTLFWFLLGQNWLYLLLYTVFLCDLNSNKGSRIFSTCLFLCERNQYFSSYQSNILKILEKWLTSKICSQNVILQFALLAFISTPLNSNTLSITEVTEMHKRLWYCCESSSSKASALANFLFYWFCSRRLSITFEFKCTGKIRQI